MDERVALCKYPQKSSISFCKTKSRVTFSLSPDQQQTSLVEIINTNNPSCSHNPKTNATTTTTTSITNLHQENPGQNRDLLCSNKSQNICKMFCSYRLCVLLLIIKIFLLGVILPVHLQRMDYQDPPDSSDYDPQNNPQLNGYQNGKDQNLRGGDEGDHHHHHHHNNNVAPSSLKEGNPTTTHSSIKGTEETKQDGLDKLDDGITVEQHSAEVGKVTTTMASLEGESSTLSLDTESTEVSQAEAPTPTISSVSRGEVSSSSSCPEPVLPIDQIMFKLTTLLDKVNQIDSSINKMESLMQTTVVDERIYKCITAITTGNTTEGLKYWNQILQYQSSPSRRLSVLQQVIKEAYSGKESNLFPVIQFIQSTEQYYGYSILLKEITNYNQLYSASGSIFTLAHFIRKSCGKDSKLFSSLPTAVQSVTTDFFTLQSKFNKGYLYYAKRCVARHYYYCLDVLTKRIGKDELETLEDEESRRYHWKLNATDETAGKFFILNQDKYWSYRLQDLNNSPRFKMEEAGSIFEMEWAHFSLQLHSDSEIAVQVRDTDIFLEGEEFKFDNMTEVLLHSYHKTEGKSVGLKGINVNNPGDRIYWIVNQVNKGDQNRARAQRDHHKEQEHENCKVEIHMENHPDSNGS